MPLYVRDDDVAAMAAELQSLINARSKTDAVRQALQNEIDRQKRRLPLAARISALQHRVAALGPTNPAFDSKAFSDEMWDGR
ncbi:type II toxin-antitoxin system VapB family antitoxin [Phreatobacter sp. AB_2022a]|uniref:type II toxin-antitoxin system VapB family antitoxin n=1 Tax=Phreatobacter sp. AB_2022a TaxID=3003134 RepID=UPI002286F3A7|nr:type II toxin-antitoxin system VapB family antitoxin [Phreatobacter sp. AB_2022a]MCZ0735725.1 type II toxin-antitoxin system VapB family antitoxin [Phreatobacter sp. AB_2022a]